MTFLLQSLDVFFFVFHTLLILFNLVGWFWKKTRKWALATQLLTLAAWTVFTPWKGFGYCPCTDWHWQIRDALGYDDHTGSYIKFLLDSITGIDWNRTLVNRVTIGGLVIAMSGAISLVTRDYLKAKKGDR